MGVTSALQILTHVHSHDPLPIRDSCLVVVHLDGVRSAVDLSTLLVNIPGGPDNSSRSKIVSQVVLIVPVGFKFVMLGILLLLVTWP